MRARLGERLRQIYWRIGIHAAPPGTLFYLMHNQVRRFAFRRIGRYASGDLYARAAFGGTKFYDIWRIRNTRQVDGLALVFFLGIGDYLFATPLIEALRAAHPGLLLHAYVSNHGDAVNAPLVETLARGNRYFDAVFTYRGRTRDRWLDYDFSDCLRLIPRNFVILPVVYSTHPAAYHRVTALFEAFGLPVRLPVPPPLLEKHPLSAFAAELLAKVRTRLNERTWRAVVACHFGTRSSNYLYPHRDVLIARLLAAGILPLVFSETSSGLRKADSGPDEVVPGRGDVSSGRVAGGWQGEPRNVEPVIVEVGSITPLDSIELLRCLQGGPCPLLALTVNSVLWPITAGLGLPNLGLHIFQDPSVHQYVYPNTYVLTQHHYPMLSAGRVYTAPARTWRSRHTDGGLFLTDFDADYVLDCFLDMMMREGVVAAA